MSLPLHRFAELEAQVAALTAERDALERERHRLSRNNEPNAEDLAERIGTRLARVEQNLREDFIGKFAGNFLLATETITSRLIKVEERESNIEQRQKALDTKFNNHIAEVSKMLAEANEKQRQNLLWFIEALEKNRAAGIKILEFQQQTVELCQTAATETANAASLCTTFADDYKSVAVTAKDNIKSLADESTRSVGKYLSKLKREADHSVRSLAIRLNVIVEAQFKRRVYLTVVGLVAGLIFSSGFLWLTQPNRSMRQDAHDWQSLTTGLTEQQHERVLNFLVEIEKEKREAERKDREQQGLRGNPSPL